MSVYLVKTYSERGRFLEENFEHGIRQYLAAMIPAQIRKLSN